MSAESDEAAAGGGCWELRENEDRAPGMAARLRRWFRRFLRDPRCGGCIAYDVHCIGRCQRRGR